MNSISLFNLENNSSLQILLAKHEFDSIKNNFCWTKSGEGCITNCEDFLTGEQLKTFRTYFPKISNDFKLQNKKICFDDAIYFFSVSEYLEELMSPIKKKFCGSIGHQIMPKCGRPTFEYGEGNVLIWYHEYGLYRKYSFTKNFNYFVHPLTHNFLFFNESEYEEFIEKHNRMTQKIAENHCNDLFIRVINVYDKESNALKYRIINTEFLSSGLNYFITPYEGDEIVFLRSYKITREISEYIKKMFINSFDFDFDKNEYYLETLDPSDFIYSYEDFVYNLIVR